jgi:hypothetical protein
VLNVLVEELVLAAMGDGLMTCHLLPGTTKAGYQAAMTGAKKKIPSAPAIAAPAPV